MFGAAAAGQVAAQKPRASVSGSEVTGTFQRSDGRNYRRRVGNWGEIKILALGRNKLRIGMSLNYVYAVKPNDDVMANTGELDGEASIAGDTAVYTSEDGTCKITIKFVRPGTISVKQDGSDADCGFGHNVFAGGTYRKVSSARPRFESN